jgi:hypothetical protein
MTRYSFILPIGSHISELLKKRGNSSKEPQNSDGLYVCSEMASWNPIELSLNPSISRKSASVLCPPSPTSLANLAIVRGLSGVLKLDKDPDVFRES